MGGLLAARVLADHFERVTLVERDRFPTEVAQRKGVPQGRHAHGLMAGGCRVLEQLLPGFCAEMVARGAVSGDVGQVMRYWVAGVRFTPVESGLHSLLVSRPLLETHVRERVLALENVHAKDDCDVLGLLGNAERIRGVRIRARSGAKPEHLIDADLVVDTSGRGSRMPEWLTALGLPAPEQENVRVDVGYTTCLYRRKPGHLAGQHGVIVAALPPNRRCGVAVALEGDRFIVTLAGYLGDHAPATHEGLVEFARGLPSHDIHELLRNAEPCSQPVTATFRDSQRRRYERLRRFPEGLLVMADAICSFNPIYGQGMSVAALEAELLDRCLRSGTFWLWREFFARAAKIIDVPWSIAVGGDLGFAEVAGERTLASRVLGAYLLRVQRAAADDPRAALAFRRVVQMVAAPSTLLRPSLMARVLLRRPALAAPQQLACD